MMIRIIVILVLAVINAPALHASNWYAAPSATSGDGSITNPWNLNIALRNTGIQPGDTLYLRGGTYSGNFVSTLNGLAPNYITVRSYPGEWAVIEDGIIGTLLTNMDAVTDPVHIVIANSEWWHIAQGIIIDGEIMQLGDGSTGTNWNVNRGWGGTTATSHSAGSRVIISASILQHTGTNTIFRDFEITSVLSTNRNVGTNWAFGSGLNLLPPGLGNKAINLVIHNTGHPAIGFWSQGDGGEVNGCLIWGTGEYDYGSFAGAPRGAGAYCQNETGTVMLKNNIAFRNFTYGLKGYGETGPVNGFRFDHNICFQASVGGWPLEVSSGSSSMNDDCMWTNYVMGNIHEGYVSLNNSNQQSIGNVIVNGGLQAEEFVSGIYSNNTCLFAFTAGEQGTVMLYDRGSANKSELNLIWDYNTYYIKAGSRQRQFAYVTKDILNANGHDGSGNLLFQNDVTNSWKDWSGFDAHSSCATNWPVNYLNVNVQRLDYDSNRWHICVVSTSGTNAATITPSDYGMTTGSVYQIMDVQNWPVVIQSGTYHGGTISLPLNLTNVSMISGTLTHYANEHSNVKSPGLFNAFVLRRIPPLPAPTNFRRTSL